MGVLLLFCLLLLFLSLHFVVILILITVDVAVTIIIILVILIFIIVVAKASVKRGNFLHPATTAAAAAPTPHRGKSGLDHPVLRRLERCHPLLGLFRT
jgi:hypothetical protein